MDRLQISMVKLFVSRDLFELFNNDQDLKKKALCSPDQMIRGIANNGDGHFGLWEDRLARQQKMTEFLLIRRCQ